MSGIRATIMQTMRELGQPMSPTDLAEITGEDAAKVATAMRAMERAGWLRKWANGAYVLREREEVKRVKKPIGTVSGPADTQPRSIPEPSEPDRDRIFRALDALEHRLGEVRDRDLKVAVLARLESLVAEDIAEVLRGIRADLEAA